MLALYSCETWGSHDDEDIRVGLQWFDCLGFSVDTSFWEERAAFVARVHDVKTQNSNIDTFMSGFDIMLLVPSFSVVTS